MTDFFDWPLADLATLRPGQILHRDESDPLGELAIALALAYNDIKDVVMIARFLVSHPVEASVTSRTGQWVGLKAHLERLLASYLHELLYLLKKHRTTFESDEFRRLLDVIDGDHRDAWEELLTVALSGGSATSALARIRNNGSFHYYQTKDLANAFREYFFRDTKTRFNRSAFLSIGTSMPSSRFYFADAAASRGLGHFTMELGDQPVGELLGRLVDRANLGIFGVLSAFVRSRGGARPQRRPTRKRRAQRKKR